MSPKMSKAAAEYTENIEMIEFLDKLGYLSLYPLFKSNEVTTLSQILLLKLDDLKEMTVPIGPRNEIIK